MDSTRSTRCVWVSAWLTTAFARVASVAYRSLQGELAPRACREWNKGLLESRHWMMSLRVEFGHAKGTINV
jgi:hypothetical protein